MRRCWRRFDGPAADEVHQAHDDDGAAAEPRKLELAALMENLLERAKLRTDVWVRLDGEESQRKEAAEAAVNQKNCFLYLCAPLHLTHALYIQVRPCIYLLYIQFLFY